AEYPPLVFLLRVDIHEVALRSLASRISLRNSNFRKEPPMFTRHVFHAPALAFLLLVLASALVLTPYASGSSVPRIVAPVNESDLVQLTGNTHPLAISRFDQGAVTDSLPMEHMYLVLRRSPEQETALERLNVELHNPHSANYHKWLTADELGRKFGPSQEDIDTVVAWLTSHGLRVQSRSQGRIDD
ncbi:MAG: protease pro-enzyme activation domain-containing protein, partial [Candidatus Sulfotelmatobacter sp.]